MSTVYRSTAGRNIKLKTFHEGTELFHCRRFNATSGGLFWGASWGDFPCGDLRVRTQGRGDIKVSLWLDEMLRSGPSEEVSRGRLDHADMVPTDERLRALTHHRGGPNDSWSWVTQTLIYIHVPLVISRGRNSGTKQESRNCQYVTCYMTTFTNSIETRSQNTRFQLFFKRLFSGSPVRSRR